MITMPFSLLNLNTKPLNFKGLPEFSGVPFFPGFSHQWTRFRKNLVSLVSPHFEHELELSAASETSLKPALFIQ
jgi:hypothetical protein